MTLKNRKCSFCKKKSWKSTRSLSKKKSLKMRKIKMSSFKMEFFALIRELFFNQRYSLKCFGDIQVI